MYLRKAVAFTGSEKLKKQRSDPFGKAVFGVDLMSCRSLDNVNEFTVLLAELVTPK